MATVSLDICKRFELWVCIHTVSIYAYIIVHSSNVTHQALASLDQETLLAFSQRSDEKKNTRFASSPILNFYFQIEKLLSFTVIISAVGENRADMMIYGST